MVVYVCTHLHNEYSVTKDTFIKLLYFFSYLTRGWDKKIEEKKFIVIWYKKETRIIHEINDKKFYKLKIWGLHDTRGHALHEYIRYIGNKCI